MSAPVRVLEVSLAGWPADGAALDLLARVELLALRLELRLVFSDASRDLSELIEFAGLGHLLRS